MKRAAAAHRDEQHPEVWVFGYGSLIWRPSFCYEERRAAFVKNRARRFWQGSTDHRGVPGAPGRVVTLVDQPDSTCWGVAYRLSAGHAQDILRALDVREIGGYRRRPVELHFSDTESRRGLTYVALSDNTNYLGPASLDEIVAQIRSARGPSGANSEYVKSLARAISELGAEDEHVFELARML